MLKTLHNIVDFLIGAAFLIMILNAIYSVWITRNFNK